ncbi:MAG TPA: hypothetical protein VF503_15330 [Sphingobium sp.]|uniref:GH39 family glycosyl hydrolase n=1 Tax=Sphingobium sp. TaxID=1912891 RepID=UPI002ED5E1BE
MDFERRALLGTALAGATLAAVSGRAAAAAADETIEAWVDLRRLAGPLPHIWKESVGSDRAAITLRETWRKDLERWRAEAGVKRVRCHGIFNDEMGVLNPSILDMKAENPNFQNVDQVYDGLVERGVAPFVELSFMPSKLASGKSAFGFYKGNTSPPASTEAWVKFVQQFVAHIIQRYGLATVRTWPIEIWNEPNLPFFWSGKQQDYFEFYKATAVAIKAMDARLQVGGPSTAAGAWLPAFTRFCEISNAPVDFFTSHAYAGDAQKELFGRDLGLRQADVIPALAKQVREQIDASAFRGKPFWLSEWSSDSPAMIAHVIAGCLPYCQGMSQWALSATFEELGVPNFVLKEGDTGWGMMIRQIAKPSFNTYKLLHQLGTDRLTADGPVLATQRGDGKPAMMVWNLADVEQPSGIPGQSHVRVVRGSARRVSLEMRGARPGQAVAVSFVDQERGSPMPAWRAMGSPQYPTNEQLRSLRTAADIARPLRMRLDRRSRLSLDLPAEGVALVEFA